MLYSDIINGLYKYGDILPSESALSQKYKVSRNTIRQSLMILSEDGFICKLQGKGSLVTYNNETQEMENEKIYNPILKCSKKEIDSIDIKYNFSPPTDIAMQKLNIKSSEIVMASNSIYYVENKAVAHAFIQIPAKFINTLPIDLNLEEDVSELINKKTFDIAHSAKIYIRLVLAEDNLTDFLSIKENDPIIYIEEILKNEEGEGIARCKFYFIPNYFDITFNI